MMAKKHKKFVCVLSAIFVVLLNMVSVVNAQRRWGQPLDDYLVNRAVEDNTVLSNNFFDWFYKVSKSLYVRSMVHNSNPRGDTRDFMFQLYTFPKESQVDFLGVGMTLNFKPQGENTKEWRDIGTQIQSKTNGSFQGRMNLDDQILSLDFDSDVFYRTDRTGKKVEITDKVSLRPGYLTYKYEYDENGWKMILDFTEFDKKEGYYFLFTDFVKLNPPSPKASVGRFNEPSFFYNPKTDMHHFVVEADKIKKMHISINKDSVTGYLEYGYNRYKFMNRPMLK